MGEELRRTLYHAAVGSVVGTLVATASQEFSGMINAQVMSAMKGSPNGAVITGVVAGSVAALTILAGEKLISMVTPLDDPLFRIFYYQTAFHGSSASWGFMRATRALVKSFTGPQYAPGPIITKKPADDKTGEGCGANCGNLCM